jgi:hypothetical protein
MQQPSQPCPNNRPCAENVDAFSEKYFAIIAIWFHCGYTMGEARRFSIQAGLRRA